MAKTRWEYRIIHDRNELSALGQEGWELVQVVCREDGETLFLKRPSPSIREEITASQREQVLKRLQGEGGNGH